MSSDHIMEDPKFNSLADLDKFTAGRGGSRTMSWDERVNLALILKMGNKTIPDLIFSMTKNNFQGQMKGKKKSESLKVAKNWKYAVIAAEVAITTLTSIVSLESLGVSVKEGRNGYEIRDLDGVENIRLVTFADKATLVESKKLDNKETSKKDEQSK